jgi:hypothetical protein
MLSGEHQLNKYQNGKQWCVFGRVTTAQRPGPQQTRTQGGFVCVCLQECSGSLLRDEETTWQLACGILLFFVFVFVFAFVGLRLDNTKKTGGLHFCGGSRKGVFLVGRERQRW